VKKKEEFRAEGSEILCAIAQPEVIPKLPKQETAYVTTVTASISKEVLALENTLSHSADTGIASMSRAKRARSG